MKKILKKLFCTAKEEKLTDENIMYALFPSLLGILVCMVCLTGLTVAWYTASVETENQTFTTKQYALQEVIVQYDENGEDQVDVTESDSKHTLAPTKNADHLYTLEAGKTYTVKLTSDKDTNNRYCMVKFANKVFYTDMSNTVKTTNAEGKTEYTFTIKVNQSVSAGMSVTIKPCWGTYEEVDADGNACTKIMNNGIITITGANGDYSLNNMNK